jgi:hypothetical protein
MTLPWSSSLDVSYIGQHAWNQLNATGAGANGQNLNTVDIGSAFLPENQDRTLAPNVTPGATAVVADLMRAFRGYGNILQQRGDFWRTYHSIQTTYQRRFRNGVSAEVAWTWSLSDNGTTFLQPRFQHAPDGTISLRDDWDEFVELNKDQGLVDHRVKANFVWDLPNVPSQSNAGAKTLAAVLNDWQLSGIVSLDSGTPYSVDFSYQSGGGSVNLTGSPDYPAKIRIIGDPGEGCSSNQYRQFNTDAFAGPLSPSVGLESGRNYLTGCGDRTVDLAIARNFRLGGTRQAQIRLEMFNAFNSVVYNGRVTGVQYNSPTDQTVRNAQYSADGTLNPNRLTPANAGFGAVTSAQPLRSVQLQLRFSF